jgi:hypothetical protein
VLPDGFTPQKGETVSKIFCWIVPGYCRCVCMYVCVCVCVCIYIFIFRVKRVSDTYRICTVLNILAVASLANAFRLTHVFAYCMLVTPSVRKVLSLQNSPLPCHTEKRGRSVTVLSQFTECVTCYSTQLILSTFHCQISPSQQKVHLL